MEKLIRHYNRLVDEGNDPFRDPPALREYMNCWDGEAFLALLSLTSEARVLEIGIGTGRLAGRVLPLCAHLTGIDCSPRSLERCRENLRDSDRLTLVSGDFLTWCSHEKFDRIYASLVFWHFQDKRAAIQKAASLLAPGGRLALSLGKEHEESLSCFPGLTLALYPDDPACTTELLREAGLHPLPLQETEFAWLLAGEAPT